MLKNLFSKQRRNLTRARKNAILSVKRMFKKIAVVSSWFLITPIALVFLFVLLSQHEKISSLANVGPAVTEEGFSAPNRLEGQVYGVQITDMRPFYVANFLKNTRLEPYSHYMVEVSDKYGLDYRLIPAIAMKESGAGNAIPQTSYNAWGFENGKTQFDSWETAIDKVGKTLKERYVDKGLVTPDQIMPVYAPPQLLTGGKWAKDINYFFEKLQSL
jgi:hypothetical protein